MICPICAASLTPEQQICANCKSDLTHFLTLVYQPDLLFNDANQPHETGGLRRCKRPVLPSECNASGRCRNQETLDTGLLWGR